VVTQCPHAKVDNPRTNPFGIKVSRKRREDKNPISVNTLLVPKKVYIGPNFE
jgi:hypothetical protein